MGMESWNFQEEKLETATLGSDCYIFFFRISCYALVNSPKPEPPRALLVPQKKLGSMEQQQLRKSFVDVRMSLLGIAPWDSPVLLRPLMTSGFRSLKYGHGSVPWKLSDHETEGDVSMNKRKRQNETKGN